MPLIILCRRHLIRIVTLSVVEGSEYLEVLFNRTQVYRPFDYAQGDITSLIELLIPILDLSNINYIPSKTTTEKGGMLSESFPSFSFASLKLVVFTFSGLSKVL